jgi:hypothetical protein
VACCATLRALMEARAPLDLIGLATRFPLDEMVHVELAARMAMELGGGTEIRHDPQHMILDASPDLSPLVRAGDMVVRFFCVGEALSIPLLRGTWHAVEHPLAKAVLGRIVKDEAAHGTFGFTFLDWAVSHYSAEDRAHLGRAADLAIGFIRRQWLALEQQRAPGHDVAGAALAWMKTDEYLTLARKAMEAKVIAPLRARGIPVAGSLS